jgi:hypothetical protein
MNHEWMERRKTRTSWMDDKIVVRKNEARLALYTGGGNDDGSLKHVSSHREQVQVSTRFYVHVFVFTEDNRRTST